MLEYEEKKLQKRVEEVYVGFLKERSRWELFCSAIRGGHGVVREQMFKARTIAELARADVSRNLPWEKLEDVIREAFPPSLREMVLKALHGTET